MSYIPPTQGPGLIGPRRVSMWAPLLFALIVGGALWHFLELPLIAAIFVTLIGAIITFVVVTKAGNKILNG